MRVINPSYQLVEESDVIRKIERIARVCYKSEDLIQESSDITMVKGLIKRQHTAMLEHADLAFIVDEKTYNLLHMTVKNIDSLILLDGHIPFKSYLRFTETCNRFIVSGNLRAWLESFTAMSNRMDGVPFYKLTHEIKKATKDLLDFTSMILDRNYDDEDVVLITDYDDLYPEERMIHETFSVLFTVDRGITHELVRMRDCSFAQESTRYCNYSNGKFDGEITVIAPIFFGYRDSYENIPDEWLTQHPNYCIWETSMHNAEDAYFELLSDGVKPQEARDVLPTSVKADIVMTTNLKEWRHIFKLRACDSTGPAHPQMKQVMIPLFNLMKEKYSFAYDDLIAAEC